MKKKAKRPTSTKSRRRKRKGGHGGQPPLRKWLPKDGELLNPALRVPTAEQLAGKTLRSYLRDWFMTPEVLAHAQMIALIPSAEGIRMFTALLNKAYPTPLGVKNADDAVRSFKVTVGQGQHEVTMQYGPMGRVPGMGDGNGHAGNGHETAH